MAKKDFGLVSGHDKVTSILKLLAAGIEDAGGTDGEEILGLLDTKNPKVIEAVKIACTALAAIKLSPMKLLRAAYNGTCWDEKINDTNFPGMDQNASIKGVRPVKIGKNFVRREAEAFLKTMTPPMKFAALDKCILWCAENPDYQRTHWMLCLAQSCSVVEGVAYVVYFEGTTLHRRADLSNVASEWHESCEVFAEEMSREEVAAMKAVA